MPKAMFYLLKGDYRAKGKLAMFRLFALTPSLTSGKLAGLCLCGFFLYIGALKGADKLWLVAGYYIHHRSKWVGGEGGDFLFCLTRIH